MLQTTILMYKCPDCGTHYNHETTIVPSLSEDDISKLFAIRDQLVEFSEQRCQKCDQILKNRAVRVKKWFHDIMEEDFDENVVLELWVKYCRPKPYDGAKLIYRNEIMSADEFACPCKGPFIELPAKIDITGYRCMNCGKDSWIP